MKYRAAIVSAALAAAGCAGVPSQEIADADAAVRAAAIASSAQSNELQRAENKLGLAVRWANDRDFKPARWLAEQAKVDAELASAKAAADEALQALAAHEAAYRKASFNPF